MQQFVFLLLHFQFVVVGGVDFQLLLDNHPLVLSYQGRILHCNSIQLALIDQSLVLNVSNLALSTSFKFFPGFLFDHGCVGVHVLSLESDLFEFFGESVILIFFVLLLLVDHFILLYQQLLSDGQSS